MVKQKYAVTGMSCSACSSHVEKSVRKLSGMKEVTVNLLTNSMQVVYDEAACSEAQIIEAVEKAGYGASPVSSGGRPAGGDFASSGGRPAGRSAAASGSRQADGGIAAFGNQQADGDGAGLSEHAATQMQRNFQDNIGKDNAGRESIKGKKENKEMMIRLVLSIVFMILLMSVSMHHMIFMWIHIPVPEWLLRLFHGNENALTFAFTQFLLTLPIIYLNRKYYQTGFKTLFHLSPNMDSLIAIGSGAALVYGIFAIYRIGYGLGHGNDLLVSRYASDLYFESAGTILTLITVGKYLETRSKGKTGEAIEKLMDLTPKTAILLLENGEEKEIPTYQLLKDDLFVVKPGSLIPVDGVVVEGTSSVNEAAITGESIPVEKQAGDRVVSATMNKAGRLVCRAMNVGEDTTLAQIIRLVEEASASKAPIAKLADKIAGVFVPTVMGIALITFFVWLFAGGSFEAAMSSAIAVLVISCPCALGLATPVAIMVGTGVGAKNGILIKSGDALQSARDVDTVVLDKTGTITEGRPRVTDVFGYEKNFSVDRIIALAAAIEKPSEHPLAEAIVGEAEIKKLEIPKAEDFQAVFGRGVQGICEGKKYLAGNRAFMEENKITLTKMQEEAIASLSEEGKTPLLFAEENKFIAVIAVADTVKASSVAAIKELRDMKIEVVMLTGDNERTAQAVRRELGINRVVAEVLPGDKEKEIRKLQGEGRKVAMIGDGINDAPALAAADVGIAIGAGTDVAIDSADIILMKSRLTDAITAIRLSRAVIRNIKENLFWAFFYNTIGIPLAAGVFYPAFGIKLNPMFGAAAMSLSSLFVVSNALRLRNFKARRSYKEGSGDGIGIEAAAGAENMDAAQAVKGRNNVNEAERPEAPQAIKEKNNIEIQKMKEETAMKKTMIIEGMMCNHCTGRVQKALEAVPGVAGVAMSLENKSAEVTLDDSVSEEALKAAVADAGYEVIEIK
ncbi:MAG: heavy metal translocating P-type ATPase [Clostridium sp.]|nr:heavy metal translocating P-type ATPase [Clostridium sp.]